MNEKILRKWGPGMILGGKRVGEGKGISGGKRGCRTQVGRRPPRTIFATEPSRFGSITKLVCFCFFNH